jgi:pectate lyase
VRKSYSCLSLARPACAACWTLAGVILALWPASASASAGFDAARAFGSKSSGRSLNWTHDLGPGFKRIVVVGVTIEDNQDRDPGVTVTFNGAPMLSVPNGVAVAGDGHGFLRTQLFYLLDASLPPAGPCPVAVRLAQTVHEIAGASISLVGLPQAPPEAVAGSVSPRGSSGVTTALTTRTPRAWIVEVAGADVGRPLMPAGPEQVLRTSALARSASVAAGAFPAIDAGARGLAWSLAGTGRLAHVAAAFAPQQYQVSASVVGQGQVEPPGGRFVEDSVVSFTAVPAPGWIFSEWSGDASGADSPVALTIDRAKSIVAKFTPDFRLSGWATADSGTTGGEGGAEVVVDTLAALRNYAGRTEPYIIKVYGTIVGDEAVRVRSNKTILGIGTNARLLGVGLQVGWSSEFGQIGNVIVRNLTFEKAHAPTDGMWVTYGAKNVWIDHCSFLSDRDHGVDYYDGLVDITNGADFITVSWSRFSNHYKTSLIGSSDSSSAVDAGHLTATYHHNAFVNSGGRNPSVRFGLVHVFDNYYQDLDDYGVASRMGAEVLVENNWFHHVFRPIRGDTSLSSVAGLVRGTDTNVYVDSCCNSITGPEATWVPPYAYALDPAEIVPETVAAWAGVGILTVEGEAPPPSAPVITQLPASQTAEEGQPVTLSVLADGTWPFTFQWSKDGVAIAGATGPSLTLANVQPTDEGSYTVTVTNAAGSVTSDPALLTVHLAGSGGAALFLEDRFTDGSRTNQALPGSAAWFTSSGSSNLTVVGGELKQAVTSSRTLLAYFTSDQNQPATLAKGERLTLRFKFRFSAFDEQGDNFRVGLLRGVANPSATTGTGFVPSGTPNTNARVSGDFGSNGPTSNVFSLYTGYAALTTVKATTGAAAPIRLYARAGTSATLLGSTSPYTQVPGGVPTASSTMAASTVYRSTLTLTRSALGITLSYVVERDSDGAVIMSYSATDPGAAFTAFDTVAFYLARTSVSFDFFVSEVVVARSVP